MHSSATTRRDFLKLASATAVMIPSLKLDAQERVKPPETSSQRADYTLHIQNGLIEIGENRFVSTTTFNGQFPGPLLKFREGKQTTVEIHNDTDIPEQLHWHGQNVPVDVDGAAEEGTPFVPAHGLRRISFVPQPSGLRFYHTHLRAGGDLNRGQYTGQVGPVYIEPKGNPGHYDREVFLTLKEFEPWFSHGGDMANDFLAGEEIKELRDRGESEMSASLKEGKPHGFEVNYQIGRAHV